MVEKVAWEVDGREIQREREGGRINSSKNLGGKSYKSNILYFVYVYIHACMHTWLN